MRIAGYCLSNLFPRGSLRIPRTAFCVDYISCKLSLDVKFGSCELLNFDGYQISTVH